MKLNRIVAAVVFLAPLACSAQQKLNAAGATFPAPIYTKWFSEYKGLKNVEINYQPIGSGGGIQQLQQQTVDFGATDGPMSDGELAAAKGGAVVHIPTVLGAVCITYNVPGLATGLKLTPEVIGAIFNGTLKKWNDARIAALNPGVALPNRGIIVAHRSDGSGTTYIFTDFLSNVSPSWKRAIGTGKSVSWPVGLGGAGNDGVAGIVKQNPGAIGYVELAYANQNKLSVAAIRNQSGNFIMPSVASTTAAAAGVGDKLASTSDLRISIVNAPGAQAYPIASFTWIIVYKNMTDKAKANAIHDFLVWAEHDGQKYTTALDYAPLPASIVKLVDAKLAALGTK